MPNNSKAFENHAQAEGTNLGICLKESARLCAKDIVDALYRYDMLRRLESRLIINKVSISVKTLGVKGLPDGNWLSYMFQLPEGKLWDDRTFDDVEYVIAGKKCRLSTEWVELTPGESKNHHNYLQAFIALVNYVYADVLVISDNSGKRYLKWAEGAIASSFSLREIADEYATDFARRYITALLAKPFVILTGNSGTGKTRIAKRFAR